MESSSRPTRSTFRASRFRYQIPAIIFFMVIILACCVYYAVKINREFASALVQRHQKEQYSIALHDALRLQEKLIAVQSDIVALAEVYDTSGGHADLVETMLRRVYVKHRDFAEYAACICGGKIVHETGTPAGATDEVRQISREFIDDAANPHKGGFFGMARRHDALCAAAPLSVKGIRGGYVVVVVTGDGFSRWFRKNAMIPEIGTLLVDNDGIVLFSGEPSKEGRALTKLPPVEQDGMVRPSDILMESDSSVLGGPFFGGRDHFVAAVPFNITEARLYLVGYSPFDRVSEPLRAFSMMLYALLILATMVVIWGTAHILVLVYRDMKKTLRFQNELQTEIRERTHAEESARTAAATNRAILDAVPDMMFRIHCDGSILDCHGTAAGAPQDSAAMRVRHIRDVISSDAVDKAMSCIETTLASGRVTTFEYDHTAQGDVCHYEARVARAGADEVLVMARDVTSARETARALKEGEEKYRGILENMQECYFEVDLSGNVTFFNSAMVHMSGYAAEELMGMNIRQYTSPESAEMASTIYTDILTTGANRLITDFEVVTKHGKIRTLEISASPIRDRKGVPIGFRGVGRDITDRKESERKIMRSLKEKETLLQEVHHRVKNNLQIVSSLLSLQSQGITDETMRALFRHSINRVKSMALIHERLYRAEDLTSINFKEYVSMLASHLCQMYNADPRRIQCTIDIRGAFFDIETAIPCGLIANELISNALEHAFPDNMSGAITVTLAPLDDETCFTLTVEDTGIGLPHHIDPGMSSTLGLRLVNDLARQLGAELVMERTGGTKWRLCFRTQQYRKRM